MFPVQLHCFRPRLLDARRARDRSRALADFGGGLTVCVVALPLAMAFGIASDIQPERGIITAIFAGFLISVLGGYAVQIMGEWHQFSRTQLRRFTLGYLVSLLGTFFLKVVFDLMVAVQIGIVTACVFFIWRMGTLFRADAEPAAHTGVVSA